ncbi:MAG: DUF4342 domain-containing protein [Acaryochloris sp. RU_4_1]|nr:DUF4342 domain-containing protein [Acaryochloris sp. RU_4_1]NJN38474.1 DUF4342 domain-containing protein [Acaryochloridaceae cyanobacterium CSU_3_4]NJR54699.1 DUF4342 domain-containing protein [Acaryochloris sp. CRU_2_0]
MSEPSDRTPINTDVNSSSPIRVEEFKLSSSTVITKIKQLIQQGNVRKIIVKTDAGRSLVEIPLTVGVIGGVFGTITAPLLTVLGVVGIFAARLTIVVEKSVE